MPRLLSALLFLFLAPIFLFSQAKTITDFTATFEKMDGYFPFYWDAREGKIWLEVTQFDHQFLYVNSLPAGIGSNDIGLDRGQLGNTRLVKFVRSGPKVLLIQPNLDYRAETDNAAERRAVEEAFAQSVLGGFTVAAEENGRVLIDLTDFLLRDAHDVIGKLKQTKQGTYKLDANRSAMFMPRTKNFPQNSEFEAMLTFAGNPEGDWIKSVTPSPKSITVRQHHSFIKLPDEQYEPRPFDPRCGFFQISYRDFAAPIGERMTRQFIQRHRLEKRNPNARRSEPIEPIVYYIDRGCPEPVKSALIEGASWWNEAFEAAGYINAFQVKELPYDADPMDVRYNLIQWVHRSTRGWSYGMTVSDPRTGEIIKGHVSLGSLRVRQDFMIAQGLIDAYERGDEPDPRLLEMALARLRQLSAHEVGHTLGLAHNFAASSYGRESVMDYPHPYVTVDGLGNMEFDRAYDVGIGEWDKRAILYGYEDFQEKVNEEEALEEIIEQNIARGYRYLSDEVARPRGGAHPYAHLWDNGDDPVKELERILDIREKALKRFDENNIPEGEAYAGLERVLVPLYLGHRYQTEAVVKLIGGVNYNYAIRGDEQIIMEPVKPKVQEEALEALLQTLSPENLALPEDLLELIPPQPMGYERDRELFPSHTAPIFDPVAAAEVAANHTLELLLNPNRLSRVLQQHALDDDYMSLNRLFETLFEAAFSSERKNAYQTEIAYMIEKQVIERLLQLAADRKINRQVSAMAQYFVYDLEEQTQQKREDTSNLHLKAHCIYLLDEIKRYRLHPEDYQLPEMPKIPPGSPIGCDW